MKDEAALKAYNEAVAKLAECVAECSAQLMKDLPFIGDLAETLHDCIDFDQLCEDVANAILTQGN